MRDDYTFVNFPAVNNSFSLIYSDIALGITTTSHVKEGACEFIKYLLSDRIQSAITNMSIGLPVTNVGLHEALYNNDYYYIYKYLPLHEIGGRIIKEKVQNISYRDDDFYEYIITEEDARYITDYINNISVKSEQDNKLISIIWEELRLYLEGANTIDKAAEYIQNRVSTYLNERK